MHPDETDEAHQMTNQMMIQMKMMTIFLKIWKLLKMMKIFMMKS